MAERKETSDGFIVLNKKLRKWRYYHNLTALGLWTYILMEANWGDQYSKDGVLIPRGSLLRSERTMAEDLNVSRNTIRYWLKKFVENGEITIQKTTHHYSVINVVNYRKYQDYEQGNHPINHPLTGPPTGPLTGPDRTKETRETKETRGGTKGFVPPTLDEVIAFARDIDYPQHKAEKFFRNYSAKEWKAGNSRLTNWQDKLREWKSEDEARGTSTSSRGRRGRVEKVPEYMKNPPKPGKTVSDEYADAFRSMLNLRSVVMDIDFLQKGYMTEEKKKQLDSILEKHTEEEWRKLYEQSLAKLEEMEEKEN